MSALSIRPPCMAGRFYEDNPKLLQDYIEESLALAQEKHCHKKRPASMVLLPHAGHFFCGHVIAETLACVELPSTLILLGPNHTGQGKALSLWQGSKNQNAKNDNTTPAWQTPLGFVPIATPVAEAILASKSGFEADTHAHAHEHSLEVILPFLQCAVPHINIVPIAVARQPLTVLRKSGEALGHIIANLAQQEKSQEIGIIISSDMHHFSDHETTTYLDFMALEAFATMNPAVLERVIVQKNISMCGLYPSLLALFAHNIYNPHQCPTVVKHATSFEKSGDPTRVVGYAGLFVPKSTCQNT